MTMLRFFESSAVMRLLKFEFGGRALAWNFTIFGQSRAINTASNGLDWWAVTVKDAVVSVGQITTQNSICIGIC
jgi:hypothetical protein